MKNVVELRTQLAVAFEGLSNGELSSKDASEMANLAGKMINSCVRTLQA